MSARKRQVEGDTSLNLFSLLRTSGLQTAPGQVSPWDCTGCELCVRICPADALKLADAGKVIEASAFARNGSAFVRRSATFGETGAVTGEGEESGEVECDVSFDRFDGDFGSSHRHRSTFVGGAPFLP